MAAHQETNNAIGERIARLEVMQKQATDRAAEDRAEMKQQIADMRKDIEGVTETMKSAVDQITGGRKVLRALWIVGGVALGVLSWASGLLKAAIGIIIR